MPRRSRTTLGVLFGLCGLVYWGSVSGCGGSSAPPPFPEAQWASARIVTDSADLIGGPVAQGRLGDALLANTRVRFIVQDPAHPRGRTPRERRPAA